MADVKYQVFISSTYTDLVKERKMVIESVLLADCIPSGMESFSATDTAQFEVIKKVIDLCDYYVLIIGGRYGTINNKADISYTEMEYNYAVAKKIPVLVFAIDDKVILTDEKKETDELKKGKLLVFKEKVMKERLASIWSTIDDLGSKVAIAILKAKQNEKRVGWVRGDKQADPETARQLTNALIENKELLEKIQELEKSILENNYIDEELAFYGDEIELLYTSQYYDFDGPVFENNTRIISLDNLFKYMSVRLSGQNTINEYYDAIDSYITNCKVDRNQALTIKVHFVALGFLAISLDNKGKELVALTEKGKKEMQKLNSIKKSDCKSNVNSLYREKKTLPVLEAIDDDEMPF